MWFLFCFVCLLVHLFMYVCFVLFYFYNHKEFRQYNLKLKTNKQLAIRALLLTQKSLLDCAYTIKTKLMNTKARYKICTVNMHIRVTLLKSCSASKSLTMMHMLTAVQFEFDKLFQQ